MDTHNPPESVAALVARARAAQSVADGHDQARVDELVAAAGWAILEPARNRALAELAVRASGHSRPAIDSARMLPLIGRVKNTVQSLLKLTIVVMKLFSAIGPRMAPRTSGASGNLKRSKR